IIMMKSLAEQDWRDERGVKGFGTSNLEIRTSDRALLAWLTRHGPGTLADFFSIQLEKHLHVGAFDLYFIPLHSRRGIRHAGARGDIVLPAVPGTGHDGPFEITLAERATTMDTGVVYSVKGAIDIKNREGFPVHFQDDPLARFHIGCACHPHELSHCLPVLSPFGYVVANGFLILLNRLSIGGTPFAPPVTSAIIFCAIS